MNYLVLMVGAPGIGKSTVIDFLKWKNFVVSPDEIRLQYQSPILKTDGNFAIPGTNDRVVWEQVMSLIEFRMRNGDFTVVDATHTQEKYFSQYKKLAEKYGYRMYAIDMMKAGNLHQCLVRNEDRLADRAKAHKYVPPEVIKRMYEKHQNLEIPKYVKRIDGTNYAEIYKHLSYKIHDYNNYDGITVIGDIHGCIVPLSKIPDLSTKNWLFIFVGDYVDRGVDNAAVMEYMLKASKLDNVIMLEGNHEIHLNRWANNEKGLSREFNDHTAPQLEAANISKSEVRQWYRKLVPVEYFIFGKYKYLITHAGLSAEPKELLHIANKEMIKGTGRYEDMLEINESFLNNSSKDCIQIHGHRNITKSDTKINERCFNLEGQVEFGGYLRTLTLYPNGVPFVTQIPNVKVKQNIIPISQFNPKENASIILQLMSSRDIKTRIQESNPNIVSFNFTKQIFYKQRWNDFNVKARGLFVNINTGKVVARSYDKFFNIGERPETKIPELVKNFQYPVDVYQKENGFLGLIGYDEESDKSILTSKSLIDGEFAKLFSEALLQKTREHNINAGEFAAKIKDYIKRTGYGLVVEVIVPDIDPHIITESGIRIVLLAAVKLDFTFEQLPIKDLMKVAKELGFSVKKFVQILVTPDEVKNFIAHAHRFPYEHEGFVFEDANNFMVKFKTPYYNFWKQMRTQVQRYSKEKPVDKKLEYGKTTSQDFLTWVEEQYTPGDLLDNINIPKLRTEWIQNQSS